MFVLSREYQRILAYNPFITLFIIRNISYYKAFLNYEYKSQLTTDSPVESLPYQPPLTQAFFLFLPCAFPYDGREGDESPKSDDSSDLRIDSNFQQI